MEKVCLNAAHVGPRWADEPKLAKCLVLIAQTFTPSGRWDTRPYVGFYATFFSTNAEFFDPNPTQLQIACSI